MNKFQKIHDLGLGTFSISAFGVELQEVEPDDEEETKNNSDVENYDDDDDVVSQDFEKTHTLCAAFTVISMIFLFLMEFVLMAIYLIVSNGKHFIEINKNFFSKHYSRSSTKQDDCS